MPPPRWSPATTKHFRCRNSEIAALYTLIGTRLAVSVTNSAYRQTLKPADPYVTISEAPAWEALERLAKIHPRFAHYTFRDACGLSAVPQSEAIRHYLEQSGPTAASLLPVDLRTAPVVVLDLSAGSTFLGANPRSSETDTLISKILQTLRQRDASIGVGRYNEARLLYTSPLFGSQANPLAERRTIHLGMDFFAASGHSDPCTARRHGSCACK